MPRPQARSRTVTPPQAGRWTRPDAPGRGRVAGCGCRRLPPPGPCPGPGHWPVDCPRSPRLPASRRRARSGRPGIEGSTSRRDGRSGAVDGAPERWPSSGRSPASRWSRSRWPVRATAAPPTSRSSPQSPWATRCGAGQRIGTVAVVGGHCGGSRGLRARRAADRCGLPRPPLAGPRAACRAQAAVGPVTSIAAARLVIRSAGHRAGDAARVRLPVGGPQPLDRDVRVPLGRRQ